MHALAGAKAAPDPFAVHAAKMALNRKSVASRDSLRMLANPVNPDIEAVDTTPANDPGARLLDPDAEELPHDFPALPKIMPYLTPQDGRIAQAQGGNGPLGTSAFDAHYKSGYLVIRRPTGWRPPYRRKAANARAITISLQDENTRRRRGIVQQYGIL